MSGQADLEVRLAEVNGRLAQRSDPADAEGRLAVARDLAVKALLLRQLGCRAEALEIWDEISGRFAEDPPVEAPTVALQAMVQKTVDLRALGRDEEAISICDELIGRDGADEPVAVRVQVARAMFVKSELFADSGIME